MLAIVGPATQFLRKKKLESISMAPKVWPTNDSRAKGRSVGCTRNASWHDRWVSSSSQLWPPASSDTPLLNAEKESLWFRWDGASVNGVFRPFSIKSPMTRLLFSVSSPNVIVGDHIFIHFHTFSSFGFHPSSKPLTLENYTNMFHWHHE